MIRKSGNRFSEKIMLKQKAGADDDSRKSHPALEPRAADPHIECALAAMADMCFFKTDY
jgi:hypothetical protein